MDAMPVVKCSVPLMFAAYIISTSSLQYDSDITHSGMQLPICYDLPISSTVNEYTCIRVGSPFQLSNFGEPDFYCPLDSFSC